MSKPHVCFVISGLNEGGGIERHVKDLTSELHKSMRVSVLADHSMASLFLDDIEFLPINCHRSRLNPLLLLELWQRIISLAPDCLHVHGRKAGRLVSLITRFRHIPTVLTLHNLSPATKLCRRFDCVIGVSSLISDAIQHPYIFTIYNGRTPSQLDRS